MYTDEIPHSSLAEEQYLGDASAGDFNMGDGISTSQKQNPNVTLSQTKGTGAQGLWQSPAIWLVIAVLLFAVEFAARKGGGRKEGTVRVGLENWFIVGGLAATWIFAMKSVSYVARYPAAIQFFGFI